MNDYISVELLLDVDGLCSSCDDSTLLIWCDFVLRVA